MLTKEPGLERLDIQLIRMMSDLREREKKARIDIEEGALMVGFSASGMFVNRFTFMHPDQVRAAAIGSPGGWPIAPISHYRDSVLRYPVGVGDFHEVTGTNFDLPSVAKVPQFIFMGDKDTNDSMTYSDSFEEQDRAIVFKLFGSTLIARWPISRDLYRDNLALATFKLYPGVTHTFSPEMRADVETFFCEHGAIH